MMKTPLQYLRLPENTSKTPTSVEGGYHLMPQNIAAPGAAIWFINLALFFIGLHTLWIIFIGTMLYFTAPTLWSLLRRKLFFAVNDWPLVRGNSYGFSVQHQIGQRSLLAGSSIQVLVSCAYIQKDQTGNNAIYNSQVLWQEAFDFPQTPGSHAFQAQWVCTLPDQLPVSSEWQISVCLTEPGRRDYRVQYKLEVV
jgi:hypothetical protein